MNPEHESVIDLVLPVYNEAHVLERSVMRLATAMAGQESYRWRIVVVNNGSTDGTRAVAVRLAEQLDHVQLVHLDEKGRGRALKKTWNETDAEFSLYMDVDLSTDLVAVPQTIELLRQGADVVTGSRLHPQSTIARCLKREILSRNYNRLIRWVLHTRSFDDAQCGFKGVRIQSVRRLLPLVEDGDWFFDTELLVLAEYAGMTVKTLPITWIEDPDTRVDIPRTVWQDLKGLARLRRTARSIVQNLEI